MGPMERRRTERLKLAIPLSVSVLNSSAPGHGTESVNVSAGGMYFATNLPVSRGTGVQLLFKMPEEITHTPASEWVCMGHVVHVTPVRAPNGWLGVGVQFDCYEVVEREGKLETGNWKMEKGKDKLEIRN
jgi:Tfp pilus assembly protein PilZ